MCTIFQFLNKTPVVLKQKNWVRKGDFEVARSKLLYYWEDSREQQELGPEGGLR